MHKNERVKTTVFISYGLNQKLKKLAKKHEMSKSKFITDILQEVVRRVQDKERKR